MIYIVTVSLTLLLIIVAIILEVKSQQTFNSTIEKIEKLNKEIEGLRRRV